MVAHGAALVVVHHDALADLGLRRADPRPDRGDDAAGLVPGDGRLARRREAAGRAAALRPPVLVQVAAAHARRLHLDDDLAFARGRIGEVHQLELAFAGKHHPAHRSPPRLTSRVRGDASMRPRRAVEAIEAENGMQPLVRAMPVVAGAALALLLPPRASLAWGPEGHRVDRADRRPAAAAERPRRARQGPGPARDRQGQPPDQERHRQRSDLGRCAARQEPGGARRHLGLACDAAQARQPRPRAPPVSAASRCPPAIRRAAARTTIASSTS